MPLCCPLSLIYLVPCVENLKVQGEPATWVARIPNLLFCLFCFLSFSASFPWPRMDSWRRYNPVAYVKKLFFFLSFCLWGEGIMADLYDFPLKSLCARFYWLCMHERFWHKHSICLYICTKNAHDPGLGQQRANTLLPAAPSRALQTTKPLPIQ